MYYVHCPSLCLKNSWVYVRYVNIFTILVLHWVLFSSRSSQTKAALYYLITGLVLALRQKNRKTARSSFETWKNDVDWEVETAKHHFHYWNCLNSTAPNYREDLSKNRLVCPTPLKPTANWRTFCANVTEKAQAGCSALQLEHSQCLSDSARFQGKQLQ